ncbi:MAG: GntR family transcriptional regulator [Bdellovibrionaceae bacterium]|nr:GntR family transcriptional regulator [Pseudobdellovibrionaceae bacterium]
MTDTPNHQVGDFACLRVVSLTEIGTFFDWGQPKDLFLPFGEQTRELRVGQWVVVHIHLDKSGRPCASMKLDRHLEKEDALVTKFTAGQKVTLLIVDQTDLGWKAIVDGKRWGLLFKNEVFQNLAYGDEVQGQIKAVRPDGKLDLSLGPAPVGHKAVQGEIGPRILAMLKESGGFLPLTDKTEPDEIYDLFGVSKKKFKIALSGLYKLRQITIGDDGIRLAEKAP